MDDSDQVGPPKAQAKLLALTRCLASANNFTYCGMGSRDDNDRENGIRFPRFKVLALGKRSFQIGIPSR